MKLLLRVTFKDMLVANSMGISLAHKCQEQIGQHLFWEGGVNLVEQLTPLDLI